MDLDAYTDAHRSEWDRLDALSRRQRLDGAAADELIDRYQSGATQLSAMTTAHGSSPQSARLSIALSRARLRFAGAQRGAARQLSEFFVLQLPAALYRLRWLTLATTLFTVGVAALWAFWALNDPAALPMLGTDAQRRQLAQEDFVAYYSESSGGAFGAQVWTNNAWIAAQCIAFGITGVWVPYVLAQNAQGLGTTAAVLIDEGMASTFFLWIAPHGLLELTAVFTAAAAGIAIFWSWVAPGAMTRGASLAAGARSMFTTVVGLILALGLSGLIEGYVTRQDWPWVVKIGIGAAALGLFLWYMLVVGRRAARLGEAGDLVEADAGTTRVYAG